jgi:acyl-CoA thioester hydrolase
LQRTLKHTTELDVKFSEADSLGIVWHGHYIRYFEDGREAFGKKYGIGYLAFFKNGFVTPIVDIQCKYKRSLRYGDSIRVEIEFMPTEAAKMVFKYMLFNARSGELVATGSSSSFLYSCNALGILELSHCLPSSLSGLALALRTQ